MKRRTVLRACGFGVVAGLAGCGSRAVNLADEVDDDTPTDQQGGGDEGMSTEDPDRQETTHQTTTETDGQQDDHQTTTETDGQQDDHQTTRSGRPRLVSSGMSAEKGRCGGPGSSTTVTFDDGAGEIVVEGSISAPTPCHSTSLSGASYDPSSDTLTLTIGIDAPDEDVVCVQCVGSVPYTARAGFDGGLPGSVKIVHDGMKRRTVAQESR